jgi:methyl-accepting chemotaxis protein
MSSDAKKSTKKGSSSEKTESHGYSEYLTAAYKPTRSFPKKTGESSTKSAEKLFESMAENGPLLSSSVERFVSAFEESSKRWQMVIYPVLFAFALLSGYGFYLIYNLTHDMHVMTYSITHMSSTIDNMSNKLDPISVMGKDIGSMSGNIGSMDNGIQNMTTNINSMNNSMGTMSDDMRGVRYDMNRMSGNMNDLSRPMSFFSGFMP